VGGVVVVSRKFFLQRAEHLLTASTAATSVSTLGAAASLAEQRRERWHSAAFRKGVAG